MRQPSSHHAVTRPLPQRPVQPSGSIEVRAAQLAHQLPLPARRVLTEATGPQLFSQSVPFVPSHPQAQEVATWLSREVGLLSPVAYGVHTAYVPTLLGLAVVWTWLQQVSQVSPASGW